MGVLGEGERVVVIGGEEKDGVEAEWTGRESSTDVGSRTAPRVEFPREME